MSTPFYIRTHYGLYTFRGGHAEICQREEDGERVLFVELYPSEGEYSFTLGDIETVDHGKRVLDSITNQIQVMLLLGVRESTARKVPLSPDPEILDLRDLLIETDHVNTVEYDDD